MTTEARIIEAIRPIVPDVEPNAYRGKALTYCAFSIDSYPVKFAESTAVGVRDSVSLHLFLPTGDSPVALKRRIIVALVAAGATYPSVINASDGDGQHYVLNSRWCSMAQFEIKGTSELIRAFDHMSKVPKEVKEEILTRMGDVAKTAIVKSAIEHGIEDTGLTIDSITLNEPWIYDGGGHITVTFRGSRRDKNHKKPQEMPKSLLLTSTAHQHRKQGHS